MGVHTTVPCHVDRVPSASVSSSRVRRCIVPCDAHPVRPLVTCQDIKLTSRVIRVAPCASAAEPETRTQAAAPAAETHQRQGQSSSVTFVQVRELPCQDSEHAAVKLLAHEVAELRRSSLTAAPSGVVRLEVAVPSTCTALQWLAAQADDGHDHQLTSGLGPQPCVYFSPRVAPSPASDSITSDTCAGEFSAACHSNTARHTGFPDLSL
jgi:hypothetical protein